MQRAIHQAAVDQLLGATASEFSLCEDRDHQFTWYLYVDVPGVMPRHMSCLKIHGGLPRSSPRIRGAVAWCRRKPGRQAVLTPLGRLFLEEAAA